MKHKHTPKPWKRFGGSSMYTDIVGNVTQTADGTTMTPVCRVKRHAEGEANITLIEALPDMLEACEAAYREIMNLHQCWYNDRGLRPSMNAVALMLEQVIAKATGVES